MKNIKRLASMAVVMLALSSCNSFANTNNVALEATNATTKYGLSINYKEGFRILWLTDLHFGDPYNTAVYNETTQYAHLKTMIEEANNPDLIVLTGDTFDAATTEQVDTFITFIDSFNIKWVFTYGNHDPSNKIEDPYYINTKIMAAKNSLFIDYKDDGIDGLANYYINVKKDNKNLYRFYIIDSNSTKEAGNLGDSVYDVIHLNQLEHIQNINTDEGDNAAGFAFYHIPVREYVNAYEAHLDNPDKYKASGEMRENAGYGYMNNGAYTCMKEAGIIGSFVGHSHRNDIDIDYFDDDNHMVMSFGLKSSNMNYCDADMVGYKIINLPSDPTTFNHSDITEVKKPY
jgi:predicted MPP superfamily phosphohydrolase